MARREKRDVAVDVVGAIAVLLAIGLAFAAGIFGFFLGRNTKHTHPSSAAAVVSTPADPQVASGAHDFVQFGCAQCHGEQGRGGVSPYVPAPSGIIGGVALIPNAG